MLLREGLVRLFDEAGYVTAGAWGDADDIVDAGVGRRERMSRSSTCGCRPTFRDEGIRAALRLRAALPATGILVLSQYVEGVYARELLAGGDGGHRLSAEGPRDLARRVHGCRSPGARARDGTRSAGGPRTARGATRPARRAHSARAGCARAHGGGAQQREHRRAALHRRRGGREEHQRDLRQARHSRSPAPSIDACSRCSPGCSGTEP